MTGFQALTVSEKRAETANAVTITLAAPAELRDRFRFRPGQYLTLQAEVDGEILARSYSISSTPTDSRLTLTVKRLARGRFSTWLCEQLEPGMTIRALPPLGRFTPAPATHGRILVGVAAGSGITPVISIARSTLEDEPASRVILLYGSCDRGAILFRGLLQDLKDRFIDRLSVHHALSREPKGAAISDGRIDAAKIAQLCTKICPSALVDGYFVCGPAPMMEVVRDELVRQGVGEARIHVERFSVDPPASALAAARSSSPDEEHASIAARGAARLCEVTVVRDGASGRLTVRRGRTGLIAAARAAGIDLPQSCARGTCGTCRAKLVAGRVEMRANHALPAAEVAQGFVLACQVRPLTPTMIIDFDRAWDRSRA